jgi:hypothetical protein
MLSTLTQPHAPPFMLLISISCCRPHHYRYQLGKKWKIKKSITTEQKEEVLSVLGKRARPGASTSDVTIIEGSEYKVRKTVDKTNLQRYIKDQMRQDQDLFLTSGVYVARLSRCFFLLMPSIISLLRWNLPFGALMASLGVSNHASSPPTDGGPTTPENLEVKSPQGGPATSPGQSAPSPTFQLIQRKLLLDRARLLVRGRFDELMSQLQESERM